MGKRYHSKNIRELLRNGFDGEELRRLGFDDSDFRPFFDKLAENTGKETIIARLIEHADYKSLFPSLLAWAKKENPIQYRQCQPYRYQRDQLGITIKIEQPNPSSHQYRVTASFPQGPAYTSFSLPPEQRHYQKPEELGKRLFEAIFSNKIGSYYQESLIMAQSQGRNLLIQLDIQPVTLASLPWEFFFDDPPSNSKDTGYLYLKEETSIIRYFAKAPQRPKPSDIPLRLLLVSADSPGLSTSDEEAHFITEALERLSQDKKIKLEPLFEATVEKLTNHIYASKPHIIHFMGPDTLEQLFYQENVDQKTMLIKWSSHNNLQLVFINAYSSVGFWSNSRGVERRSQAAQFLAQAGVPAVVVMQLAGPEQVGITFAQRFYKFLAEEFSIDEAVTWARMGLNNSGGSERILPILYLQPERTHLFKGLLPPPSPPPLEPLEGQDSTGEANQSRQPSEKTKVLLEIYFEQGKQHIQNREWEEAVGFLQRITALESNYRGANELLDTADNFLKQEALQQRQQRCLELLFKQAGEQFDLNQWRIAWDILEFIQATDATFQATQVKQKIQQAREKYQQQVDGEIRRLRTEMLQRQAQQAQEDADWIRTIYILEELRSLTTEEEPEYQSVQDLLDEAYLQKRLQECYALGSEAFEHNDWSAAKSYFGEVYRSDKHYQDVAEKLKIAQDEQDLDDRRDEGLKFLDILNWAEALKSFAPIRSDDLRRIEAVYGRRYAQARLQMENEQWDEAVKLLQPLAKAPVAYRDAGDQLKIAEQQARWANFFKKAQEARQNKKWDRAIDALQAIVDETATDKYFEARQQEAQRLIRVIRKEEDLERWYTKAQNLSSSQHWSEAVDALERVGQIQTELKQTEEILFKYENIQFLLAEAQQQKEWQNLYHQAIQYVNAGNWDEAIEKFGQLPSHYHDVSKQLETVHQERKWRKLYEEAEEAIKLGDFQEAARLLEGVIEVKKDHVAALNNLHKFKRQAILKQHYEEARRYLTENRWQEAIEVLEKLESELKVGEDPLDQAYADTPQLLVEARQQKSLADAYKRAQEAMAHRAWDEAISALQEIQNSGIEYKAASALLQEAQSERAFSQAYEDGRQAYNAERWSDAIAHLTTALTYKRAHSEAEQMIREATRRQAIAQALQDGQRHENEEIWPEAIRVYRRIIDELDPYHTDAINRLGQAQKRQELVELLQQAGQNLENSQWGAAVEALQKAILLAPADIEISKKLDFAKRRSQIAEWYEQALKSLERGRKEYLREELQTAINLFKRVEQDESGYKKTEAEEQTQSAQTEMSLLEDYDLAELLFKAGKWAEATDKFQKINERREQYRNTLSYLRQAQANQVDEKHWLSAEKLLQPSEPTDEELFEAKAELEQIEGDDTSLYLGKAEQKLKEIQSKLEVHLQAYYDDMIKQASDEEWKLALETLGKIHFVVSKISEPKAEFRKAPSKLKEIIESTVGRYRQIKDFETARTTYQFSKRIDEFWSK
ncbi:MAG: hypothetical protein DPW09_32990 [Anaerolineae bacterium]|nr:CHAT domain-containing protein [Anaerolineales bacterium]MCQ3978269.1 hypothetical protein [Anaerolineae bacterium]